MTSKPSRSYHYRVHFPDSKSLWRRSSHQLAAPHRLACRQIDRSLDGTKKDWSPHESRLKHLESSNGFMFKNIYKGNTWKHKNYPSSEDLPSERPKRPPLEPNPSSKGQQASLGQQLEAHDVHKSPGLVVPDIPSGNQTWILKMTILTRKIIKPNDPNGWCSISTFVYPDPHHVVDFLETRFLTKESLPGFLAMPLIFLKPFVLSNFFFRNLLVLAKSRLKLAIN